MILGLTGFGISNKCHCKAVKSPDAHPLMFMALLGGTKNASYVKGVCK